MGVYFVTMKEICRLHDQFFNDPSPTDCITFPIDLDPATADRYLGDIFIAPEAALAYPGCDRAGPCARPLQAKMSIRFCVAAALAHGDLAEPRFHDLDDPAVARLTALCALEADPALTAAFPAKQGARVQAHLLGGEILTASLDDVTPAAPDQIRQGLRAGAGEVLGSDRTDALLHLIDRLDAAPDAAVLPAAARSHPPQSAAHRQTRSVSP